MVLWYVWCPPTPNRRHVPVPLLSGDWRACWCVTGEGCTFPSASLLRVCLRVMCVNSDPKLIPCTTTCGGQPMSVRAQSCHCHCCTPHAPCSPLDLHPYPPNPTLALANSPRTLLPGPVNCSPLTLPFHSHLMQSTSHAYLHDPANSPPLTHSIPWPSQWTPTLYTPAPPCLSQHPTVYTPPAKPSTVQSCPHLASQLPHTPIFCLPIVFSHTLNSPS